LHWFTNLDTVQLLNAKQRGLIAIKEEITEISPRPT